MNSTRSICSQTPPKSQQNGVPDVVDLSRIADLPRELKLDIYERASTHGGFLPKLAEAAPPTWIEGPLRKMAFNVVERSIHRHSAGTLGAASQPECDAHRVLGQLLPPLPQDHGSATDGWATADAAKLFPASASLVDAFNFVRAIVKRHLKGLG